MSRPTPETDNQHKDITRLFNAAHLGFVSLGFARRLERERDEAWEIAKELRDALVTVYNLPDSCPCGITNDAMAAWHDVGIILGKAKEVLP